MRRLLRSSVLAVALLALPAVPLAVPARAAPGAVSLVGLPHGEPHCC